MAKLLGYLRVVKQESDAWIVWAVEQKGAIDDQDIDLKWGDVAEQVKAFSSQLFVTVLSNCEGDAWKLIQSAGTGNGLEGMRLLTKRYDPRNPGTKRSILRNLLTIPACTKVSEVEKAIMRIEEMVKKYESMTGGVNLPDDLVATVMISVCHKELRDWLELSTDDMKKEDAKAHIFNFIERKRSQVNEQFVQMELDNVEYDGGWYPQGAWEAQGDFRYHPAY